MLCFGGLPFSWRDAMIVPITKPAKDYNDPNCPVALSSCVCKAMERMILFGLWKPLNSSQKTKWLPENQKHNESPCVSRLL